MFLNCVPLKCRATFAGLIALVVVLASGSESKADGFRYYENWGGPGHGGGEPTDALDRAYRRHDLRYTEKVWWRNSRSDAQLIEETMAAGLNPFNDTHLHGRLFGPVSAGVFAMKPSFYETRIFGQTIPIPSTGLTSVGLHATELGVKGVKKVGKGIGKGIGKAVKKIF